jgi:SAM-dependent methyltransferase
MQEWQEVKALHEATGSVTLGAQGSHALLGQPDRMALMLARYWAASGLIGNSRTVLEVGCGEGLGAGLLSRGRMGYAGVDFDEDAIAAANRLYAGQRPNELQTPWGFTFAVADATRPTSNLPHRWADAVVSLDVIEHIPIVDERRFMENIVEAMRGRGPCVIGTPNEAAYHLASPASQAGHINLYTHNRLQRLLADYFSFVQVFGMNDLALHFGHPEMRHYLLAVGIGLRDQWQTGGGA